MTSTPTTTRKDEAPQPYAWIIHTDHLHDQDVQAGHDPITPSRANTIGPRNAPAALLERLYAGEGWTFKMYDDDGSLYYSGRLVTPDDETPDDATAGAPLWDFGQPDSGCVTITYPGHPDWTCA